MRPIRKFDEFIKEGIVKKQTPDKSRAEFLVNESKNAYKLLLIKIEKLGVSDDTANDLSKSCYDILMQLIRAKMLLDGYNATGIGAHEAEISYLVILKFNEKDIQFLDQLRYFRNGMLYYGTQLDKEYAVKVIDFTKRVYLKLMDCIK
ncbi:MAG: hypothetical protein ACP5OZ_00485 [Candidatus Woesearchaeota archaeon]